MARHFLIYQGLHDRDPVGCSDEPVEPVELSMLLPPGAFIVRKLTGCCPVCGVGISRLKAEGNPNRWKFDPYYEATDDRVRDRRA